jgi:hypothetical protein
MPSARLGAEIPLKLKAQSLKLILEFENEIIFLPIV